MMTVKVFGLELQVCVESIDCLAESLDVFDDLTHGRLIVGCKQAFKRCGNNSHRLNRDMVSINHLHIRTRASAIFGWGGAFAARTDGIETTWSARQNRFEAEFTVPVIDKIVEVGQALPTV